MISFENKHFILNTKDTSYVFELLDTGHLRHLYYGDIGGVKYSCEGKDIGNSIAYDKSSNLYLEDELLEVSGVGKGDIRESFIELINPDGSLTSDFLYVTHCINNDKPELKNSPSPHGECEHLEIVLKDKIFNIYLHIHYYLYGENNIICRNAVLINKENDTVLLKKLMSTQFDFDNDNYAFTCFKGSWANEMHKVSVPVTQIKLVNSSFTGTSSSRSNPFVMISEKDSTENNGKVYGFNLIYSGNHYECVDTTINNRSRFVSGINPECFEFNIHKDESFESPLSVMTFSKSGYNGMSQNMHNFINANIVRGKYRNKIRPVLINTWEAFYFDIEETKLLNLAKRAKDLGIELFALDDGWFLKRNDDTSSLGDWKCDLDKIPHGLKYVKENVGMKFGLWIEPEMINTNSDLYRKHPEWCVEYANHSEGRNQRFLDLTNNEVVEYLVEVLTDLFNESECTYVKWDLNRIMSDLYSKNLKKQTEFVHRYYLGFYRLCKILTERFPDILFEGCSAGGNRFDLGIMSYFPQVWASDNTDSEVRRRVLYNCSYGYPLSVIGSHVSACPNHQTGRSFNLDYRYEVAKFGCFGYELDLNQMSEDELETVKKQIMDFKENRETLQFGRFIRTDETHFRVEDKDKTIEFDYSKIKK